MSNHRQRRLFNEVNVVPYIDVSLVLLLVFMISAPLIQQGVEVDLPKASAKTIEAINEQPIIITIDEQANLYLNLSDTPEQAIDSQQLIAQVVALKRLNEDLAIYVRGDRKTYYANILRLMALLQNYGIENVGLMTDPSDSS